MSAFMILGGNSLSRQTKIVEIYRQLKPNHKLGNDLDTYTLTSLTSIGIAEIRNLENLLALKPFGASPKIVIIEGEKLTFEAQTAFLKTLEEPPGETIFLISCPSKDNLLPTIVSRCQTIQLPAEPAIQLSPTEIKSQEKLLGEILQAQDGKRLLIVEEEGVTRNREEAEKFCQSQLIVWREKLLTNPSLKTLNILKQIQKTLKYIRANVNVKLAVENLVLNYPKTKDNQ